MKTISLIIISAFLFSIGTGVFAQETELPDPGLTPDSPFYFLETIAEEIGTFFTFGDLKKAERYATLAAERLAEVQAVVEKGKPEFAEKTLARYRMQLQNSIARAEKAQTKGENTEKVMAKVGKATSIHLEVLAEVYEKVPEEAKPAVENAMKVSVKGHEKAVEALKAQNALGEIPEEATFPAQVPQEVRERVQMRAQQELEVEKAERAKENDLQSFESFRAFCIEQGAPPEMCASFVNDLQNLGLFGAFCAEEGAPPEMCEKIPPEGFKSFEQIEDFCIEAGGTPELCSSVEVEAKCREAGVTTPDECFLVLMTATVTTSASPLSEEEMEERRIQMEAEEASKRKAVEEKLSSGQLEALAKCLTEKGAKFYVSENCVHCEKQKEVFGDAASFLPYIDCADEETRYLCEEAGVGVVPAWDFPGKERALGLQPFEQLAELSGCSLQ